MRLILVLMMALLLIACLDPMDLPVLESDVEPEFNPDTTYLPMSPVWGLAEGLNIPIEVVVSHARQIYVADMGIRDVLVLDQAGKRLDVDNPTFATLDFSGLGDDFTPMDIDVDSKLNLLVIDGSNKVYRWNQFYNIHGIDSIAAEILVVNDVSGERVWLPAFDIGNVQYLHDENWRTVFDSCRWVTDAAIIDSLLSPHLFLDMEFWVNEERDLYYSSTNTHFSAVSAARLDDSFFYVADSLQNRILRAAVVRTGLIKLGNGEDYFTHTALFADNVKEIGTGAGTVNRPTGMDVDGFGNLYYSQYGRQMFVHSVLPSTELTYPSRFELFVDEIMDPNQYAAPTDVAVDAKQFIYVANTELQEVLVFNGDGTFFKKAGIEQVNIDTTQWFYTPGELVALDTSVWVYGPSDSSLVDTTLYLPGEMDSVLVDTFYTIERKGQLIEPVSVAADERGVIYVCDPSQGSVMRFILSTSFETDIPGYNP